MRNIRVEIVIFLVGAAVMVTWLATQLELKWKHAPKPADHPVEPVAVKPAEPPKHAEPQPKPTQTEMYTVLRLADDGKGLLAAPGLIGPNLKPTDVITFAPAWGDRFRLLAGQQVMLRLTEGEPPAFLWAVEVMQPYNGRQTHPGTVRDKRHDAVTGRVDLLVAVEKPDELRFRDPVWATAGGPRPGSAAVGDRVELEVLIGADNRSMAFRVVEKLP
jgi:hypothetical protein